MQERITTRLAAVLGIGAWLAAAGCGRQLETPPTHQVAESSCLACHGTAAPPPGDTRERVIADIVDTHFDDWRFDPDGSFVTTPTDALEGYVLDAPIPWADEGIGYVSADSDDACGASCHDGHLESTEIGRQWATSGHADINSEAWLHDFTNGACMQCHSSAGYALYVDASNVDYPGWSTQPDEETFGHRITCNACHDATGVPSAENRRLRKVGVVEFVSGSSASRRVYDAVLEAGNSATCITCHQARESGGSLFRAMAAEGVDPSTFPAGIDDETMADRGFINPHYRAAGAMLFSLKGFEYPGRSYTPGNLFHQGTLCTGCHMSPSDDPRLGGHSFNMHIEGRDHVEPCQLCHGPAESFDAIGLLRDFDGDGVYNRAGPEIEKLKELLLAALEAEGIYYDSHSYPYFFTTPDDPSYGDRVQVWQESQLTAAFNFGFVNPEPGAFVHNAIYAAQLLWDSFEAVTGAPLPSARPSGPYDRPAVEYRP